MDSIPSTVLVLIGTKYIIWYAFQYTKCVLGYIVYITEVFENAKVNLSYCILKHKCVNQSLLHKNIC